MSDFEVFRSMAAKAGFRDAMVRKRPIAWAMASIDSLLGAFADWAHMDRLPGNVRTAVETHVRQAATAYESAGTLTIPNPAILVCAVK